MKAIITSSLLTILFLSSHTLFSQNFEWVEAPYYVKEFESERTFKPNIPKSKFKNGTDWASIIDSIWGPGLPTGQKLIQFDILYKTIDESFACFQDIDDRWQEMGEMYRTEIENGVSRGRFVAIMDHMTLSLQESHTGLSYAPVHLQTAIVPGVPFHFVGGWGYNNHFGAGLTPQDDGSLLVYKVIPNHPLGLKVGDIVLGYEGEDWESCYKRLLEAQLPLLGFWWGSSPSSFHHSFMMAAGLNWHLFDTIDIKKYDSGEIQNLSLTPMENIDTPIFCTEQLEIPGVSMPRFDAQELVSFGIIDGTNIGYIYALGWFWNAEEEFTNAINTLMDEYNTDGLIMDFRTNYGGNMFLSDTGLDRLFPEQVNYIDYATRCNSTDHLLLCPGNQSFVYNFGNPNESYDKPIALLTGPGAISSGDQVALRMKYHPNVRTFGKSTSTAFNAPSPINFTNSDWSGRFAEAEFYLLEDPTDYLTHNEFKVDEDIWLTPDMVAQGKDDVVESAKEWIENQITSTKNINDTYNYDLYPNPNQGIFTIKNNDLNNIEIAIFNLLGEKIIHQQLSPNESKEINILKSGTYIVCIDSNKKKQFKKLICKK